MINKKVFWWTVFLVWLSGSIVSVFFTPNIIMTVVEARMKHEIGVNVFSHKTQLSTYVDREVVRPNNDTLYSAAWLELDQGPLVLNFPDMDERYFSFQFLNGDTSVSNVVGTRTTGKKSKSILIVGPDWKACEHSYDKVIHLPETTAWLLGRTLVDGIEDLPIAARKMNQYELSTNVQCG